MEDVGGGEFALEKQEANLEEQEVLPNFVHPNTHISGQSETHLNIIQD